MLIERSDQSKGEDVKSSSLIDPPQMVLYPLGNSSLHEQERGLHGHFPQFECLSFMASGYRYYGISVRIVAP